MTDKPATAGTDALDPGPAKLDRPFTELTADELMALKAEYQARGIRIYNSASIEQLLLAAATGISSVAIGSYTKAFAETLAKHNAEGLIEFVRTRIRKKGKTAELLVGPEDNAAAALVIPRETPTTPASPCSTWTLRPMMCAPRSCGGTARPWPGVPADDK